MNSLRSWQRLESLRLSNLCPFFWIAPNKGQCKKKDADKQTNFFVRNKVKYKAAEKSEIIEPGCGVLGLGYQT